jgi:hypothetical protein
MTNLSDLFPAGAGKQVSFVADGAISAAGKPVILNSAGTVTPVGFATTAESIPAGAENTTSSSYADGPGMAVDPTTGNAVAAYKDWDNSGYGYVVVGVVSGTTLTWGTPIVFESTELRTTPLQVAFDPNTAGSFVIVFQLSSTLVQTVIANTLSGSTLGSFGTAVAFQTTYAANSSSASNRLGFDPNTAGKFALTNVLIAPSPGDSGVVIGTVSGTTVAFAGSAENWDTSDDYPYSNVVWNPNVANEIVVSYIKVGWWAKVVKGTVSGTTVSWGTPSTVNSGHSDYFNLDFDPNTANSFAWAFFNGGTGLGASGAGTLVGSTWTFGSNQTVPTGGSGTTFTIKFDPNQAGKLAVINRGSNGVNFVGSCTAGSVSGTTLTWGSANELTANGDIGGGQQPVALSFSATDTGKFVSVYALGTAGGNELGGVVCQLVASITNLTSTNFIGISDAAISDTASGNVTIKGGIAATGLTSLTPGSDYYAQDDGTITTASAGKKIGRAMSATSINLEYQS